MPDRLGIEFISVLALPPVAFVELAARLGVGNVGVALAPITANPCGYPAWSLRDDPALRRDLVAALASNRVAPWFGEGIFIRPGSDVRAAASDLDLMAEIGIDRVNTIVIEPDTERGLEQLAAFAKMAAARGMTATLEYMPGMAIGTLQQALDAVRAAWCSNLSVLVDCMHFARSGGRPEELSAVDPALIGHVQLCDVPMPAVEPNYGAEALHNRLAPGEGDLPLAAIFAALPRQVSVGLELPMLAKAQAGIAPEVYLGDAVARARALLAAAGE
jgi:sugar phosphate isomerase/epimerase